MQTRIFSTTAVATVIALCLTGQARAADQSDLTQFQKEIRDKLVETVPSAAVEKARISVAGRYAACRDDYDLTSVALLALGEFVAKQGVTAQHPKPTQKSLELLRDRMGDADHLFGMVQTPECQAAIEDLRPVAIDVDQIAEGRLSSGDFRKGGAAASSEAVAVNMARAPGDTVHGHATATLLDAYKEFVVAKTQHDLAQQAGVPLPVDDADIAEAKGLVKSIEDSEKVRDPAINTVALWTRANAEERKENADLKNMMDGSEGYAEIQRMIFKTTLARLRQIAAEESMAAKRPGLAVKPVVKDF